MNIGRDDETMNDSLSHRGCCDSVCNVLLQWRNRGGALQGQSAPPKTSDCEYFADVSGKKRQGKKGNRVKIEKKKKEIVKGKVEN